MQKQLHSNQDQQYYEDEESGFFPPPPPPNVAYDVEMTDASFSPLPPPPSSGGGGGGAGGGGRGRSVSLSESTSSYGLQQGLPGERFSERDTEVSSSPAPYQDGDSERSISPAYHHRWNAEDHRSGGDIKPGLRLLADVLRKPKPKSSVLHAPYQPPQHRVKKSLTPEEDSGDDEWNRIY